MCYLAHKAGSDLWPTDARQFDVIKWLSWDTAHFSRHGGMLYFQNFIKGRFGMGDPDAAAVEEAMGYFKQFAAVLDNHLKGRDYLVGDALTVADFAVSVMLPYAAEAQLPLDGLSEIRRWQDTLNQLPAWRDPFPN